MSRVDVLFDVPIKSVSQFLSKGYALFRIFKCENSKWESRTRTIDLCADILRLTFINTFIRESGDCLIFLDND